jgi:hypothetical protein
MEVWQVTLVAAFVASITTLTVGFLTHYSGEQRERLSRQYSFREKQLEKFYAPILARLVELSAQWQLAEKLTENQQNILNKMGHSGDVLKVMGRAQDYVIETHKRQNVILEEMAQIARENFNLAEASTVNKVNKIFRSNLNRKSVTFGFPIDASGEPIPSLSAPFSPDLVEFMQDIQMQHNRLAKELRTAQFNDLQLSDISEIRTTFPNLLVFKDVDVSALLEQNRETGGTE